MRALFLRAVTVAAMFASALVHVDSVRATEAAPKQEPRATIGGAGTPDLVPADPHPHMLTRVPGARTASRVDAPVAAKLPAIETELPADGAAPTAAQRAKLAETIAATPKPEASSLGGAKPDAFTTILAPRAGAPVLTPDQLERAKQPAAPAIHRMGGVTSSLGMIPRPEWSIGTQSPKAAEVSTIGKPRPGAASTAVPSALEIQRRAAATAKSSDAKKQPETSTSEPRAKSAPPADAVKSDAQKQEVQP